MQYQVPQGIDLEDKIIGPLTLIQFLYLLVGGIVDYMIFLSFNTSWIFFVLAVPIALVALAMAFLKIQDQPLSYFARSGLLYFTRPKRRVWSRQGYASPVVQIFHKKVEKRVMASPKKQIEKSELEKLASALDTGAQSKQIQNK